MLLTLGFDFPCCTETSFRLHGFDYLCFAFQRLVDADDS